MARYLLSVLDDSTAYDPGTGTAAGTAAEMAAIDVVNEKIRAEGHWVFADGLAAPSTATVVDARDAEPVFTDGPYLESKEIMAGFWVIEAPDLDVALGLAAQGSKACNRRVELRPFL